MFRYSILWISTLPVIHMSLTSRNGILLKWDQLTEIECFLNSNDHFKRVPFRDWTTSSRDFLLPSTATSRIHCHVSFIESWIEMKSNVCVVGLTFRRADQIDVKPGSEARKSNMTNNDDLSTNAQSTGNPVQV